MMIAKLADLEQKNPFIFCQTHYKAKKDGMPQRVEASKIVLEHFKNSPDKDLPTFVTGDFNEEPQNAPIDLLKEAFTDIYGLCGTANGDHPQFTTFKHRAKEGYVRHTIDYVFVLKNEWFKSSNLKVVGFTDAEDLETNGQIDKEMANPCVDHPSDHYSLAYKIKVKF